MDYVIPILAIFITLSFLLKVGLYPRWGTWLTALCCALFVLLITPWVTEQSKTAIAAFFASREKMLDVSVCITLEAAILITFCFDCFSGMRTRDTAFKRSVTFLLHLYPGLLIGGVLCYVLAELLFSFPGIDFNMLSWTVATTTFLLIGIGARLLQILLGDKALRLEILFIVNIFIVVLSIIATGY